MPFSFLFDSVVFLMLSLHIIQRPASGFGAVSQLRQRRTRRRSSANTPGTTACWECRQQQQQQRPRHSACCSRSSRPCALLVVAAAPVRRGEEHVTAATTKKKKKTPPEGRSAFSSSSSTPHVEWQDDDVAIVYKPAGMSVVGDRRDRAGVSLETWWATTATTSTSTTTIRTHDTKRNGDDDDDGDKLTDAVRLRERPFGTAVTPLNKAIGGLAAVAKTRRGYDHLRRIGVDARNNSNSNDDNDCATTQLCGYAPLIAHQDEHSLGAIAEQQWETDNPDGPGLLLLLRDVTVVGTTPAASAPYLSLVRFRSTATVAASTICAALARAQCPVVGTTTDDSVFGHRGPGGIHLALVELSLVVVPVLPSPDHSNSSNEIPQQHESIPSRRMEFRIDLPKKLAKTQRREMLHAGRRQRPVLVAGRADDTTAAAECQFMGVRLAMDTEHLRPRPSSQCLVHAATEALILRRATVVQEQPDPPTLVPVTILDIGCGPGSLLLATLEGLHNKSGHQSWTTGTAIAGSAQQVIGVGIDIDKSALSAARANAGHWAAQRDLSSNNDWAVSTHWCAIDFGRLDETDFDDIIATSDAAATRAGGRGFDVNLCNPPFLRGAAAVGRTTNERSGALYAGVDGLDAYRSLASSLERCRHGLLAENGGVLLLQLPAYKGVAATVKNIFETKSGFRVRQVLPDDRGLDRCLVLSYEN